MWEELIRDRIGVFDFCVRSLRMWLVRLTVLGGV